MTRTVANITSRINGYCVTGMAVSRQSIPLGISPLVASDDIGYELDVALFATEISNPLDSFPPGAPLIGMGEGFICQHCQSYTPRGKYLCRNCTAPLVKKELIRPFTFPFRIANINTSVPPSGFLKINLTMVSIGEISYGFVESLIYGSFHIFKTQEYVNVVDGVYLCPYCGTAATGERCEACDAGRLPFHELIDMQHDCIYCGNKTVNGIVCDSCGARMSGTAIHEKMGIDYHQPFYEGE